MKTLSPRNRLLHSKAIPDILSMTWESQDIYLRGLPVQELEALYPRLNRFRYSLVEQHAFIRLFLSAHALLQTLRVQSQKEGVEG